MAIQSYGCKVSLKICRQVWKGLIYTAAERTGKPKRFTHINKLYYMKSFRVTMRHCRKKEHLVELKGSNYCLRWSSRSSKKFFELSSLAVSSSLSKQETRLHLKLESSLILSYPSSWQALKRCMRITSKILVEFLNVHHHRIEKEPIMMVFRLNLKGILKE